jgi:hypothetical protein
VRWRIEVECQTGDPVVMAATMEMTVDLLSDALTEMGMEPAVEATLRP